MDYEKLFYTGMSGDSAKAWRASGKKALGTICAHVPSEIVYAAGIMPVRLRATGCVDSSTAETWMSSFSCSYARSILQYLMDGTYELDGIAASDGCLMASRIYDNWEHISKKEGKEQFLYQIDAPRVVKSQTIAFYKEELQILADKLSEFSGIKITDESLRDAVAKYNEARALVKKVYELRNAKEPVISGEDCLKITLASCDTTIDEYNELLKAFLADAGNRTPITGKRARLMLIGSALDNPEYVKVIEAQGAIVVSDALCHGCHAFGEELVLGSDDIWEDISRYYLERIVCPRMLDNRPALHKLIVDTAIKNNVDGIIYQKMQYCECWGGESYNLEPALKAAGIPLLMIEREEHMANAGQLAVRAEAFVEMIEKEG